MLGLTRVARALLGVELGYCIEDEVELGGGLRREPRGERLALEPQMSVCVTQGRGDVSECGPATALCGVSAMSIGEALGHWTSWCNGRLESQDKSERPVVPSVVVVTLA